MRMSRTGVALIILYAGILSTVIHLTTDISAFDWIGDIFSIYGCVLLTFAYRKKICKIQNNTDKQNNQK